MDSKLDLKYRPDQLEDLIGQKHIVATLKKASENNRFASAYLFSGERGCGKTSMSRIVATLMTCENVKDGKVCGECQACKSIKSGMSMDVKEVNGADKRKIEDARSLIENAYWSPQELKRKIITIDEAHMLTKEANNSLLKILEEPPSYLTFILCTTEIKKILPTIMSRCQRFNFRKISTDNIIQRLDHIAKKEGINIETEALLLIARFARGSMRDAVNALEQVGTIGINKRLTRENVRAYFGLVNRQGIMDIVKAIKSANIPLVMDQVNDLIMASADIKSIMEEISEIFRNIMLLKAYNNDEKRLINLTDAEIQDIKLLANVIDMEQLTKLSDVFSNIDKKIEFNINERWVMEATLINCVAILRNK